MKFHSIAAGLLFATAATGSMAYDVVLPPLNPSAPFGNTVNGDFQDTFQFSVTELTLIYVSITNNEIALNGSSFGGILNFSGFIDGPVGEDVALTYSTTPVPGPDGSTFNVQRLEGEGEFQLGTYTVVITGTGITGSTASYGGNIVAKPLNAVPEPGTFALVGLSLLGLGLMRRRS